MAGTGKTTIACTLAEALETRGQLAASFFCSRTSPECRDANRIVPTVAYQLASRSSPFRVALCRVLEENPDIASLNISAQFEQLLKKPLVEVKEKMANNMVVVIDALDECDDPRVVGRVLDVLFQFAANLPIKFFVTSRPEPAIQNKMNPQDDTLRSFIHLHEIEQSFIQADIELYLQEELKSFSLSPDQLKQLADLSGNLFIFAATVVRYMKPNATVIDPKSRLATMLGVDSNSEKKSEQIDSLYSVILTAVLENENLEPDEREVVRLVLWAAVCAREPVSAATLASFAGLEGEDQAIAALEPLRSVLHVSEQTNLISTLHASFPDYIFNQDRSGRFFCNEGELSQLFARRCFEIMKGQLRFNICNLPSSSVPDREVSDLKTRIEENISGSLSYVCRYWAEHLERAASSAELCGMVEEFLSQRLLFWMEVLNLKECMAVGPRGLSKVQTWLGTTNTSSDLLKITTDAHRFVASFAAHAISASTPHIYISALPLCPESSSVSNLYRQRMRGLMEVDGPAMVRMGRAALATWTSNSPIYSVAFSPDGTQIVFADAGGSICIRSVDDGRVMIGPFKAHKQAINSVGYSPSGQRIVSGSNDETICMWDVSDGSPIAEPFKGHADAVTSVQFSPDSARIVSGSQDCTIRVWDASNGTLFVSPFKGHTRSVNSVGFSSNGALVVSGSADHTIRVWTAHDGVLVAGPFEGHTGPVMSVAFSLDGARIVSGSYDHTIRVWNTHNGTPAADPFCGHTSPINSVAFSPDGTHVVSGSNDESVRVWSVQKDALVAVVFKGHTNWIKSVGFSPDGTRIISGSRDGSVRIWNALERAIGNEPTGGHTWPIGSIAISPNSTRIVSGSNDRTVRVWDTHNGSLVAGPFEGHTGYVKSVAFSPDGAHIVSGSDDHTIQVWHAQDGSPIGSPFEGHSRNVRSVAFSPDGTRIVSGSNDRTIQVWSAYNGSLVAGPFKGHVGYVGSVAFSPDGAHIVSGSEDRTIRVWSAQDGLLVTGPLKGHTHPVTSVAFSPDGVRIVSGSEDRTIRVWSAQDGTPIAVPFSGHTGYVTSVAFSPDGSTIVSGSDDRTVRLWDAHTGQLAAGPFEGHTSSVVSVAYSPDGTFVASSSNDYSIRIWGTQTNTTIHTTLSGSWLVRDDGWLLNDKSELLFWVPAEIRGYFPRPSNVVTIGPNGAVVASYTNMLLGTDWNDCYIVV